MAKKQLSVKQTIIRAMPYVALHVLLKHNALHSFLENVCNPAISMHEKAYEKRNAVPHFQYIPYSHIWRESKEGWHYWANIHHEVIESLT